MNVSPIAATTREKGKDLAKRQIVLDTDVGIDDAMMIISVAAEPEAELVAIGSCHGNCDEHRAAQNAIRVLDVLGLDSIPVAVGEPSPLPQPIAALHVHGQDGLGDAGAPGPSREPSDESAVDQLLRLSSERTGELDLVAVGGLTNLATALEQDADVLNRFRSVWTLGGYSRRPGGPDAVSEDFNVFTSPEASDRVFAAATNLTVVPIDTTFRVIFSDAQLERITTGSTQAARLVTAILPFYLDFYDGQHRYDRRTIPVHDPVVPAVLLHPDLIRATERKPMIVEPQGDRHWGVGVSEGDAAYQADRPQATIVTDVNAEPLLDRLVDAIVSPLGSLTPLH